MKKYFIVLILGLFLGFCFARSAYAQENYFTPMTALQAGKENSESKKENSESSESKDKYAKEYYYKQYTYPVYIESGDFFETKYALTLQNVKYPDVEFTLTYLQPYIIYSDVETTTMYIPVLLDCIEQNIQAVVDTIDYCGLLGYEDVVIQTLQYLVQGMENSYNNIRDLAFQYIDAYFEEDFASCIKYMIAIENFYWELFVKIGSLENPNGTNTVTITYTEK